MTGTIINGRMTDCVASTDRGLLYGDGLFETIAVVEGEPGHWQQHLQRLQAGCARLGIEAVDELLLAEEYRQLVDGAGRAVVKIIVTRGPGGRGYRVPARPAPTRILQLHDWPDLPLACARQGVAVRMCDMRLGHNPRLAGIKHLNRLEQVLARQEWDDTGIMEGLLLDSGNHLVEGTMSNLFLVRDGVLLTPDLQRCGVAGIMRSQLLALADQLSINTEVCQLGMADLQAAEEVFICNSLIGIWPVISIDDRKYTRGIITSRLQDLLASETEPGWQWRT
ncbi:MAG: aminodeoxychorismate lyase [Gammaproteobacteria bacterium]|jgi:4-amino-4-deoxychorismate lyase|nr:aminodeoxychorismate lyase [Gammaproteobacteria bacterium]MDH3986574.1 aminodeoxychorismate lyase [Gammaproteobacteria bacterium]